MGEVYRARDARLRRDVALKVLHEHLSGPENVQRLAREARAAGSLNHPNIVSVFDVGIHAGVPYVVSELLRGESLRQRLDRGPIPWRRALEVTIQIAEALAAAHAKGIYHRDVKPANLFITSDNRVKLLDFGLAKLEQPNDALDSDDSTASVTAAGRHALGTLGYMAPEQAVGEPIDQRTDIFALGAVLYEMLAGVRAFRRPSRAATINAILNEEPADLLELAPDVPIPVASVVRRCLEKAKEARFQSARDLGFTLRQLEQLLTAARGSQHTRSTAIRTLTAVVLALVAGAAGARLIGLAATPTVAFHRLTFKRGRIGGARFTQQAIVYSGALAGGPLGAWVIEPDGPESRSLGYVGADVLSARSGKLALAVRRAFAGGERFVGTLAEAPLGGGAPRELLENVEDADWDASGHLAVARSRGQGAPSHLEYPIGRTLYRSTGSIHFVRVAPSGRHIAFLEDSAGAGSGGRVVVLDEDGHRRVMSREWGSARGVSWSPKGDEVWYTAGDKHANRSIRAIGLDGGERIVLEAPGGLTIWDASRDGRVLVTRDDTRKSLLGVPLDGTTEQDLSWFDAAGLGCLSADGRYLLFDDRFGVYLRPTDGSPATKLGSEAAWADDLSPDGLWAVATSSSGDHLILLPTGPGDPHPLPSHHLKSYAGARWFPDSRRILANGREEGMDIRSYVTDREGTRPQALTTEGIWGLSVSPDGGMVAAVGSGRISLWRTDGAASRDVPDSGPADRPVAWTTDANALWIFRRGEIPARIYRVDVTSGQRRLWRTIAPADVTGVDSILDFEITPDGRSYFYTFRRVLSELYLVRGLR